MKNPGFAVVKPAAENKWHGILAHAGLSQKQLSGKHTECPGCGGKDRFRFLPDTPSGQWFCSQGGEGNLSGDGFDLLVHLGMSKPDALNFVAQYLGVSDRPLTAEQVRDIQRHKQAQRHKKLDEIITREGWVVILCAGRRLNTTAPPQPSEREVGAACRLIQAMGVRYV